MHEQIQSSLINIRVNSETLKETIFKSNRQAFNNQNKITKFR